jgi:flagellar biosynthesis protein FliR
MVISFPQIELFLLIVARLVGLFLDAPVLSAKSIPMVIKVGLIIWLATVFWFVVPIKYLPDTMPLFVFSLAQEILIGYVMGFVASIVLQSAQAAGDILDMQMGLSVANVLSPTTGAMTSLTGTLLYMVALVVFLIIDGHHMVLSAVYESFTAIPLVTFVDFSKANFLFTMLGLMQFFWISTLQLCAPMLLLIFLIDFSFGIMSRVAPQVNVFMLGFQVKPSLGLFGLMLISPLLINHMISMITSSSGQLLKVITIMAGR